MEDWANGDVNLLKWRAATGETAFEKQEITTDEISEQEYFDHGTLLVAFVRAGVELAFEAMTESGIIDASAYYESLHETPLIANCIARNKLYEMNVVISDTAEYGNYLFANVATPLLREKFMPSVATDVIGRGLGEVSNQVDNAKLIEVNEAIRNHPVEYIGEELRSYMSDMKRIAVGG